MMITKLLLAVGLCGGIAAGLAGMSRGPLPAAPTCHANCCEGCPNCDCGCEGCGDCENGCSCVCKA
jgi:hypothetical protein